MSDGELRKSEDTPISDRRESEPTIEIPQIDQEKEKVSTPADSETKETIEPSKKLGLHFLSSSRKFDLYNTLEVISDTEPTEPSIVESPIIIPQENAPRSLANSAELPVDKSPELTSSAEVLRNLKLY